MFYKLKEYAFGVLEGIQPGLTAEMNDLENYGASKMNNNYFYRFFAFQGTGEERQMIHVFNVQAYPEVRLTHYENKLELDEEASDRLEPGNG